ITNQTNGKCVYLKDRNIVLCPMGKFLYPRHYKKNAGKAVFLNTQACNNCTCRCTAAKRGMYFEVGISEFDFEKDFYDKDLSVKQIHIKPDSKIYKQRKSIAEHPFGTVKKSMDGRYCLTKGKRKVTGEFALLFMAYNLKRVINILGSKKIIQLMNR
ncbi:MAG: transposase, partial [Treponema sp.]|nr:transposase [Treponema sp.]